MQENSWHFVDSCRRSTAETSVNLSCPHRGICPPHPAKEAIPCSPAWFFEEEQLNKRKVIAGADGHRLGKQDDDHGAPETGVADHPAKP